MRLDLGLQRFHARFQHGALELFGFGPPGRLVGGSGVPLADRDPCQPGRDLDGLPRLRLPRPVVQLQSVRVPDRPYRIPPAAEILATVPHWFGVAEANEEYRRVADRCPTLVANENGQDVGFLTVVREAHAVAQG